MTVYPSECECKHFNKCLMILNLMLDGEEASAKQEDFFYSHLEKCIVCFSHYNVERQIRRLLKTKLQKREVPRELTIEIRNKIVQ